MKPTIEQRDSGCKVYRNTRGRIVYVDVPMMPMGGEHTSYRTAFKRSRRPRYYRVVALRLLTREDGNQKIKKGSRGAYLPHVLHFAPHWMSGFNVCAQAHRCAFECITFNGKGQMERGAFENRSADKLAALITHALRHNVHAARIAKTRLFMIDPEIFLEILWDGVSRAERRANKLDKQLVIRLNGTSDVPWEIYLRNAQTIFHAFPNVEFYDYSKLYRRVVRSLVDPLWPRNYDLTFSRDETNDSKTRDILQRGGRVAIVVRNERMKRLWGGSLAKEGKALVASLVSSGIEDYAYPVIDGDKNDLRHIDPRGIVALYAKGRAARDNSGFAVTIA